MATEILDDMQAKLLKRRDAGAIKVPIALSNEQINVANRLISPLTVQPADDAWMEGRYSMHPQLFIQSWVAAKLLSKKRAEEFGTNMVLTAEDMPDHPPCMLMDGREEMRVKKAVLNTDDWNLRMSNYLTEGCCTTGVQKCTKPSEVLICNNVLFWLNAKSLFEVFQRKNVQAIYAAMPMPAMILAGCEGTDEVNGVRIRHIGKDKLHMTFVGDESMGYLQERDTWEMFAKQRVFDGHKYGYGFNILIEVYKSVGITQLFHLTKVVGPVNIITELTPNDDFVHIYNFIDRMVEIADVLKSFSKTCKKITEIDNIFSKMPTVPIPRKLLTEVEAFLFDRRDSELDRQQAGGIISSKIHAIVIGHYSLQVGMTIDSTTFADIVILVIIRSFINRKRATKSISFATTDVLSTGIRGRKPTLWQRVLDWFKKAEPKSEEYRVAKFAERVMGDTYENEYVRRKIFANDRREVEIIHEKAKAHKNLAVVIPAEREFNYDPDTSTDCGPMCLSFLNIKHQLQGGITQRLLEEQLAQHKVAGIQLKIVGSHATLAMKTSDVCEHMKYNKCHEVLPSAGVVRCSDHFDKRFLRGIETNNFLKTSVVACDLKGIIHNISAMPFNDAAFWQELKKVVHWAMTKDYGRKLLPPLPKKHKVYFNRNILCEECVATIPIYESVYADVGNDLPIEQLAAFQLRVLQNLSHFYRVAVKLQNFKEVLRRYPKALVDEIKEKWVIYEHDYFQANEVFAIRGYKPSKLQKLDINKFTYVSNDGGVLVWDEGIQKKAKLAVAFEKEAEQETEEETASVQSESEYEESCSIQSEDSISLVEESEADEEVDALEAIMRAESLEVVNYVEPREMPTINEEEVENFDMTTVAQVAVTSTEEAEVALTGKAVGVKPKVEENKRYHRVNEATRKFSDGIKDKRVRKLCSKREIPSSLPAWCLVEKAIGAVHHIENQGVLALVRQWLKLLPQCCDVHAMINFADRAEYAMRLNPQFARALREGRNFKLAGDGLPYLFGKYNAAGRILNSLRNVAIADPRNGEIGKKGTRITAENLFGDWFSMDDYEYFRHHDQLDYIRGKLVWDARSPCKCLADMPFHGVVVAVEEGKVVGPLEPIPKVDFQEALFSPCTNRVAQDFVTEMYKEEDGNFKELHQNCGNIAAAILEKQLVPREIRITEGTYGSGKTRRMINEIKSRYDMPKDIKLPDKFIVICPTKALANEYRREGVPAYSWSTGMVQMDKKKDRYDLFIDEVFLMDPRFVSIVIQMANNITMIGDRRQMRCPEVNVDRGGRITPIEEHISPSDINRFNVAFATPLDVVNVLNQTEPEKTYTRSRVVNSAVFEPYHMTRKLPNVCPIGCKEEHKHVYGACFDKAHAHTSYYPTVATQQGIRDDSYHLYVTPNAKALMRVHGQLLVALTRHKKVLHIHLSVETLAHIMGDFSLKCKCNIVRGRMDYECIQGPTDVSAYRLHVPEERTRIKATNVNFEYKARDKKAQKAVVADPTRTATYTVPREYLINERGHGVPIMEYDGHIWRNQNFDKLHPEVETTARFAVASFNDPNLTSQIIEKVAPTCSNIADPHVSVSINTHRGPREGRAMMIKRTHQKLTNDNSEKTNVMFSKRFGALQLNNTNHMIATGAERYLANKRDEMQSAEVVRHCEQLKRGFQKFVDVYKLREPTTDELALCRGQALSRNAAKKCQPYLEKYGTRYHATQQIKGFNKDQLKAKIGENTWLNTKVDEDGNLYIKGGQPVSAQPKEVNGIVSPWVSWTERVVFTAFKNGVFPGYGWSSSLLRDAIRGRLDVTRDMSGAVTTASCDISEQDTSKSEATDMFMRWIYRLCGVPDSIVDIMEKPNVDWTMDAGDVKMKVKYQFQSGRADTLFSNTMHTIGLIGMSFDFSELQLALFQGDDCLIKARGLTPTDLCYHRLKIDYNPVGEFVGFLISDEDLHLDLPRIAAKTLTKSIATDERREELMLAVRDLLSLIKTPIAIHMTKMATLAKYQDYLHEGDVEAIYAFLVDFARSTTAFSPSSMGRGFASDGTTRRKACTALTSIYTIPFHFEDWADAN